MKKFEFFNYFSKKNFKKIFLLIQIRIWKILNLTVNYRKILKIRFFVNTDFPNFQLENLDSSLISLLYFSDQTASISKLSQWGLDIADLFLKCIRILETITRCLYLIIRSKRVGPTHQRRVEIDRNSAYAILSAIETVKVRENWKLKKIYLFWNQNFFFWVHLQKTLSEKLETNFHFHFQLIF